MQTCPICKNQIISGDVIVAITNPMTPSVAGGKVSINIFDINTKDCLPIHRSCFVRELPHLNRYISSVVVDNSIDPQVKPLPQKRYIDLSKEVYTILRGMSISCNRDQVYKFITDNKLEDKSEAIKRWFKKI